MDNVVVSPHASALTPDMSEGRRRIFKENLRRFLANEPFLYVCDKRAGLLAPREASVRRCGGSRRDMQIPRAI